nr:MFS transporter [Microbispora sp. NBRC 16548]
MGTVMADTIAATLVVPLLDTDFTGPHVRQTQLQWVVSAFAVALAAGLTTGGRLADLLGRRRLLAIGLATFSAAATMAVLAPTLPILLIARAVQGLGAAAMVPASLALLIGEIAPEHRSRAIGVWSAAGGLSGVLMHTAGGWLGGAAGWHVLLVPSAAGAAVLLVATAWIPDRGPGQRGKVPDLAGAMLFGIGVTAILAALANGPVWGWRSPGCAALVGVGCTLLSVTLWRSSRHPNPAIEISLWRAPLFTLAGAVSGLYGMISIPLLAIGPRYLNQMWSYSPAMVGLAMAPLSAGVWIASLIAGRLSKRPTGPRPVIYGGAVTIAGSAVLLIATAIGSPSPLPQVWLPAAATLGLGFGAVNTGASVACALSSPPDAYGAAVGANMTTRQLGGALGMATAALLIDQRASDDGPIAGYITVIGMCIGAAILVGYLSLLMRTVRPSRSGVRTADGPAPTAPHRMQPQLSQDPLMALYMAVTEFVETATALAHPTPSRTSQQSHQSAHEWRGRALRATADNLIRRPGPAEVVDVLGANIP